jgi:hypothetical protein
VSNPYFDVWDKLLIGMVTVLVASFGISLGGSLYRSLWHSPCPCMCKGK